MMIRSKKKSPLVAGLSRKGKSLPNHVKRRIGDANSLYAFGKLDEAIQIFEEILRTNPELDDITQTMSDIYMEKGDIEKSFMFAKLSAVQTRTDASKWLSCAELSKQLSSYKEAIYCYNRAAKSYNEETHYKEILSIKF